MKVLEALEIVVNLAIMGSLKQKYCDTERLQREYDEQWEAINRIEEFQKVLKDSFEG
jgi:hypothetical protein